LDATTFDLAGHKVFLDAEWKLSATWLLHGGFSFRRGDVVSSASSRPDLLQAALAWRVDEAFCPLGGCFAYRLEGDTYQGSLGVQVSIGPRAAVDLSARYFATDANGGNAYHGTVIGGTFLYHIP
jgi:hypothetical protein